MDSAKLNDWMQIVGIFAVVLSLIFVGLQLKQSQEIAIAAQYQARFSTMAEILSSRQLDPDHARHIGEREVSWNGFPPDFDQNTSTREYGRQFLGVRIALLTLDNYHFQYESGYLAEDAWAAYLRLYIINSRHPVWQHYFENYKDTYRLEFQKVIEKLAESTDE